MKLTEEHRYQKEDYHILHVDGGYEGCAQIHWVVYFQRYEGRPKEYLASFTRQEEAITYIDKLIEEAE